MTDASDLCNAGEVVVACDQAWTLSHIGVRLKGKFSSALKASSRQRRLDERKAGALSPAEYDESMSRFEEQLDGGAYDWGSPYDPDGMGSAVAAALAQTSWRVRLVQLLLEEHHGPVTAAQVRAIHKENAEGLDAALAAALDPNSRAPATARDAVPEKPGEAMAQTFEPLLKALDPIPSVPDGRGPPIRAD